MGKIYLCSDLHFGHSKAFLYEPRGFSSIQEHDETIIKNICETVDPDDDLWILGDLMLGDNEHGMECLRRLPGHLHIVLGNHDTSVRQELYSTLPNATLHGWAEVLRYKKYTFYLSHYHTDVSNLDDQPQLRAHTLNLFGHTHQKNSFWHDIPYYFHVGLDSNDNRPISLDDIIQKMKEENQKCIDMCGIEVEK